MRRHGEARLRRHQRCPFFRRSGKSQPLRQHAHAPIHEQHRQCAVCGAWRWPADILILLSGAPEPLDPASGHDGSSPGRSRMQHRGAVSRTCTKQFAGNVSQVSNQINSIAHGPWPARSAFLRSSTRQPEADEGYVTLVNAKRAADGTLDGVRRRAQTYGPGSIRMATELPTYTPPDRRCASV